MTRERPILFSAPMVRALLAGTKTQTRRIEKASFPLGWGKPDERALFVRGCPYGVPGDRLWVRETWSPDHKDVYPCIPVVYLADGKISDADRREHVTGCTYERDERVNFECLACVNYGRGLRWRPSIHMPRRVSRLTLEITEVRVQRLHEISEEDARAEGVDPLATFPHRPYGAAFFQLWQDINGVDTAHANPWVWAISFKRLDQRALSPAPQRKERERDE